MSASLPLRLAFVGCGDISGHYARSLKTRPDLVTILGAFDLREEALAWFCREFECARYPDLEAVLADDRIDLVVNLTIQSAHHSVTRQCLEAGRHVHSEKPLALTRAEANEVVALADAQSLRLSCSTFTWMGEAQQTTWKAIREGMLGEVRVVFAEMNWNRIEFWHRFPIPFYAAGVGPLFDVGVYSLGVLTTLLGPVSSVSGFGKIVLPERRTLDGEPFTVGAPDIMVGGLEFASGALGRLTCSFYVGQTKQQGIEFHGDAGTIHLESAHNFESPIHFHPFDRHAEWTPVPYVKEPYPGVEWGRAIFDIAEALTAGRPHRCTGAQAAHVVDICCGIAESAQSGAKVPVTSTFPPPEPMPWAG